MAVAYGVEKDIEVAQYPAHRSINGGPVFQWLISGGASPFPVSPWPAYQGLDGLHRHVPLLANLHQRLKIGRVLGIVRHPIAAGQQDRVKFKAVYRSFRACFDSDLIIH